MKIAVTLEKYVTLECIIECDQSLLYMHELDADKIASDNPDAELREGPWVISSLYDISYQFNDDGSVK